MNSERWRQIEELYHAALERDSNQRAAFLSEAGAGDEGLRLEVESLLSYRAGAKNFIESPAMQVAAELMAEDRLNSAVGQRLSHYQILSLLGRGGMSEVYLALDTRLGRKVALKLLPAQFTQDEGRLRRFVQEAKAASSLNHPNIITIYEIGEIGDSRFIATEFIEGQTLRELIANSQLNPGEMLEVAAQVTGALAAAHAAGIVHRDIKPENIMVRPDGLVKVLDFGLAKLIEPLQTKTVTEGPMMSRYSTEVGMVLGTVNYMSPEQARGQKLDARTDLFSFGVVLYEMITGRPPFAGASTADVIASIIYKEPQPLTRLTLEVPEALKWIVSKALRKEREDRYRTARELLTDLKNIEHRLEPGEEPLSSLEQAPTVFYSARELEAKSPAAAAAFDAYPIGLKRSWRGAVPALAALVLLVTSIALFARKDHTIDSVAVLPFVNESANSETEYLADGITESLTINLSQLSNLKVRPRNSVFRYKGSKIDPQVVGRELNVEAVLMGRVVARGDELTISLELIDVRDNRHLWGDRYQRKFADLLTIEKEIAREVSENLRLQLSSAEQRQLAKGYTVNVEAYRAYLRGRYFWNKRSKEGFEQACEYFNQAIAIDPNYALAYSGLADCHLSKAAYGLSPSKEGFRKAKEVAKRALAIDDALAEAHTSLAHIAWLHDWNWVEAERGFKRAIKLNPDYPTVHQWYAIYLSSIGRHQEAIAEVRLAQTLDPLSFINDLAAARIYYFARQYDQAIEQNLKAFELDPGFQKDNNWLRLAYEQKGLYDKAFEETLKIQVARRARPEDMAAFKEAYAASGWKGYWRKHREMAEEQVREKSVSPYFIAGVYARLGDNDKALEWLQEAYKQHAEALVTLKVDPVFDGLRLKPGFQDLLRNVGLKP